MDSDEYTPPANFSCHSVGVFRSSFPARKNFSFLRALRLKSILYLCPEEYPEANLRFCEANGIALLRFPMDGNKEPMQEVPEDIMHAALSALVDVRNHPILIHCNAGKHRTGAVSGCLRRLQGWALTSVFHEYNHFAGDKGRLADQLFLELYRPVVRVDPRFVAPWFEPHCGVTVVLARPEGEEVAAASALGGEHGADGLRQDVAPSEQGPEKDKGVIAT